MFGLGAPELVLILLLVVLLFGSTKIPALGRSIGEGLTNFKRGLREGDDTPPTDLSKRAEAPAELSKPVDPARRNEPDGTQPRS